MLSYTTTLPNSKTQLLATLDKTIVQRPFRPLEQKVSGPPVSTLRVSLPALRFSKSCLCFGVCPSLLLIMIVMMAMRVMMMMMPVATTSLILLLSLLLLMSPLPASSTCLFSMFKIIRLSFLLQEVYGLWRRASGSPSFRVLPRVSYQCFGWGFGFLSSDSGPGMRM